MHPPHLVHADDDFTTVVTAALLNDIIDIDDVAGTVDPDLWQIAISAMKTSLSERTQSVHIFREELEAWCDLQEGRQLFQAAEQAAQSDSLSEGGLSELALRDILYQCANIQAHWPQLDGVDDFFTAMRLQYGQRAISEGFIDNALHILPAMAEARTESEKTEKTKKPSPSVQRNDEQTLFARLRTEQERSAHAQSNTRRLHTYAIAIAVVLFICVVGFAVHAGQSWSEASAAESEALAFLNAEQAAIEETHQAQQQQRRLLIRSEMEHALNSIHIDHSVRGQYVLASASRWENTWPWKRLLRRLHRQQSAHVATTHAHAITSAGDWIYAVHDMQHIGRYARTTGRLYDLIAHDISAIQCMEIYKNILYFGGELGVAHCDLSLMSPLVPSISPSKFSSGTGPENKVTHHRAERLPLPHTVSVADLAISKDLALLCSVDDKGLCATWSIDDKRLVYQRRLQSLEGEALVATAVQARGDQMYVLSSRGLVTQCSCREDSELTHSNKEDGWYYASLFCGEQRSFMIAGYGNGATGPRIFKGEKQGARWLHLDREMHAHVISNDGTWWGVAAKGGHVAQFRPTFNGGQETSYFQFRSPLHALSIDEYNEYVLGHSETGWMCYAVQEFRDHRVCHVDAVRKNATIGRFAIAEAGLYIEDRQRNIFLCSTDIDQAMRAVATTDMPSVPLRWRELPQRMTESQHGGPSHASLQIGGYSLHIKDATKLMLSDSHGPLVHLETIDHKSTALAMHADGTLFAIGVDAVSVLPVRTADASWWEVFRKHEPQTVLVSDLKKRQKEKEHGGAP